MFRISKYTLYNNKLEEIRVCTSVIRFIIQLKVERILFYIMLWNNIIGKQLAENTEEKLPRSGSPSPVTTYL